MSNLQKTEQDLVTISAMPADDTGLVLIRRTNVQLAYSRMLFETGAVSRARFQTPHQVFVGIQACKSLGLNPLLALRSCGFINGHFTLYSYLPMAVVRKSPKYKGMREFLYVLERVKGPDGRVEEKLVEQKFENNNLHKLPQGAVCEMYRHGEETVTRATFDMENARVAGLLNKAGPWKGYPQYMLAHRARAAAINMLFSDVTNGVAQAEYDVVGVPEKAADMRQRHLMQTQALKELSAKLEAQTLSVKSMDEVVVDDPFKGISSRDLRDIVRTPEAMKEFERRKKAHEAKMQARVQEDARSATDEERADFEKEMGFTYDEAVKKFNRTTEREHCGV